MAVVAVVFCGISVTATTAQFLQNFMSVQVTAEWLSAWSTFWGAVAGGIGAIGTAGALVIGAYTYLRHVRDQHRAQAAAVTVTIAKHEYVDDMSLVQVFNGSNLPIYNVELFCLDHEAGLFTERRVRHVVIRDEFAVHLDAEEPLHEAFVRFTDASSNRWTRWSKGKLIDQGREPADFDLLKTPPEVTTGTLEHEVTSRDVAFPSYPSDVAHSESD